jgi:hypothetical protein
MQGLKGWIQSLRRQICTWQLLATIAIRVQCKLLENLSTPFDYAL